MSVSSSAYQQARRGVRLLEAISRQLSRFEQLCHDQAFSKVPDSRRLPAILAAKDGIHLAYNTFLEGWREDNPDPAPGAA